jgi:hypothetical protein
MLSIVIGAAVGMGFSVWASLDYPWRPWCLPAVLVAIDVAAAIGYAAAGGLGEWRKVIYWLAAASLTYVVTW